MPSPVQPFRFLDLPPELRNAIYELIATETTIKIRALDTDLTSGWPGICFVNRQIRQEVIHVIYLEASFHSNIQMMDFKHVVLFLNQTTPACHKALCQNDGVVLEVDGYFGGQDARYNLLHWVRYRAKQFQSGGPTVDFKYTASQGQVWSCREREHCDMLWRQRGYAKLTTLYERMNLTGLYERMEDDYQARTVKVLLRALWSWAHPGCDIEPSLVG